MQYASNYRRDNMVLFCYLFCYLVGFIMLVKEIMTKKVVSVSSEDTVFDACMKYKDFKVGCLVVTENDHCVGLITERDIIERSICQHVNADTTMVSAIMSVDIKTVNMLERVEKALDIMEEYGVKKLPVVYENQIVGIITVTDISRARPEISQRFVDSWIKPRWK